MPRFVLDELEQVLRRKLDFDDARVAEVVRVLESVAAGVPEHPQAVDAVTGEPADDIVLACAIEAGADVLVTGDRKHLLPLGVHRGVRLLSPQALLAELHAAEW